MIKEKQNKTIAFFSTTRADFGELRPLIRIVNEEFFLNSLLFVGGTHLASEYGKTIDEIISFNFDITDTFDYLLNNDQPSTISKSMAIATSELSEIFNRYDFDIICVLGDRYELLPIILNAILFRKPIIHLFGGEKTEGVIDEQVRHMITKSAHLHFVSCETYAENIKNMGEESWRIHNTGVLSADAIINREKISKKVLFNDLGLDNDKKTVLLNYHPVTLGYGISTVEQLSNIFKVLDLNRFQIVVTGPNAETGSNEVDQFFKDKIISDRNIFYIKSLGSVKFYNLISYCEFVIGNSSSGITDVPFFRLPSINIGDRQKGRIRHKSIIDCGYDIESIEKAMIKALSKSFKNTLLTMDYRLGDGKAAEKMLRIIKATSIDKKLMRK